MSITVPRSKVYYTLLTLFFIITTISGGEMIWGFLSEKDTSRELLWRGIVLLVVGVSVVTLALRAIFFKKSQ